MKVPGGDMRKRKRRAGKTYKPEFPSRLLKHIARKHDGFAGVYAAVLKEGVVKPGDELSLFD